eukprot:15364542-Ditylum_brightwellii.AAC.1
MEFPVGLDMLEGNPKTHVLRLNRSIYGLEQNSLMIGVNNVAMNKVIASLHCSDKNFEFTEQGSVQHYLRVEIVRSKNSKVFKMRQLYMIKKLVEMICITPNIKGHDNPLPAGFNLSGYFYAGCPVLWQSKIALSTAEAEYIALSSAMIE